MPPVDDEIEPLDHLAAEEDENEGLYIAPDPVMMARVTNPDPEDHTWPWDSVPYTVPAGKSRILKPEIASHLQKYFPSLQVELVEAQFKTAAPQEFKDDETGETFPDLQSLLAAVKARAQEKLDAAVKAAQAAVKPALTGAAAASAAAAAARQAQTPQPPQDADNTPA